MTIKRPDVILRNKSKKQRKAVKKSWENIEIREKRCKNISKSLIKRGGTGRTNYKHSIETKKKIGLANSIALKGKFLGKKHPNWKGGFPKCAICGKQLKNRYAKKCRSCHIKAIWKTRKKNGWKMTEITKQKIRKKVIIHLQTNALKQDTSIELKIKKALDDNNVKYEHPFRFNDKFLCDFALTDKKIIIECDGDYWHNREDIKKRDKAKNAYIKKCGWKMLRFWEKDINNDIEYCIKQIFISLEFALP